MQCWSLLSGASRRSIEEALPETKRNRSGYNIAGVCRDGKIDLARMLASSEGTLAIFTKITLRTVPLAQGQRVTPAGIRFARSYGENRAGSSSRRIRLACELMEESLINMAFDQLPQYRDILPAGAAAVLLIEHVGDSDAEVKAKIAEDRPGGWRIAPRAGR